MKIYDKYPELSNKDLDKQLFVQMSLKELILLWASLSQIDWECAESDIIENTSIGSRNAHDAVYSFCGLSATESFLSDLGIIK